ncbi:hypothetical protein DV701_12420 [Ornithinimicrobium avium]|uniref:ZIP family zinc transporter n=2 Tax=Ornithinimicrobium avium TaxID=2283195 RepID=A0A345NST8_9MICO|nr:hypothetical protein DV701_12420 [Ornithinimicrobium avium]
MWGALAASSLLVGAVLALLRDWSARTVGLVLGFGAGALIASVSFELAEEGVRGGGALAVGAGLALGALAYALADRAVEGYAARGAGAAGLPLAVGALLDGIPEQVVLGGGLAAGGSVSVALLVAIFVSNLPESIGSSADMLGSGRSRTTVLGLWGVVAVVCTLATAGGAVAVAHAPDGVTAGIQGFAAGALLVMLIDSMIPEARKKGGELAGLATVVGFALAAGLSLLT